MYAMNRSMQKKRLSIIRMHTALKVYNSCNLCDKGKRMKTIWEKSSRSNPNHNERKNISIPELERIEALMELETEPSLAHVYRKRSVDIFDLQFQSIQLVVIRTNKEMNK